MSSSAGCHSRSRERISKRPASRHRPRMLKPMPAPCAAAESSLSWVPFGASGKGVVELAGHANPPRASAGLCEREPASCLSRRSRWGAGPCDRGFASSRPGTKSLLADVRRHRDLGRHQRAVETEQKQAPVSRLSVVVCADRLHRGRRSKQRAHSYPWPKQKSNARWRLSMGK